MPKPRPSTTGYPFAYLREMPDYTVIDESVFSPIPVSNDVRSVDLAHDETEFGALLDRWAARLIAESPSLSEDKMQLGAKEILEHETTHGRAARIAGFSIVKYAILYTELELRQRIFLKTRTYKEYPLWMPVTVPLSPEKGITKLALASIIAAPHDLSPSDSYQLHMLGYLGARDVCDRVVDHNTINPANQLMAPQSVVR